MVVFVAFFFFGIPRYDTPLYTLVFALVSCFSYSFRHQAHVVY